MTAGVATVAPMSRRSPTTAARWARDALLLRARADQRRARVRRDGGRRGRGGARRRAPARPRRARGAGGRRPRLDGAVRRRLPRRPDRGAPGRRRHRHEREDDDGLPRPPAARGGRAPHGLLGTVQSVVGGEVAEVERTTPEAIDLQAIFARMLEAGDAACVMEVSSHALVLHRADAIHFDAKVFTNLTQDHLDFHADMEDYFEAKRLLFTAEGGSAVAGARRGRLGRQRRRRLRAAARRRPAGRRARGGPASPSRPRAPRPTSSATRCQLRRDRLLVHGSTGPTG